MNKAKHIRCQNPQALISQYSRKVHELVLYDVTNTSNPTSEEFLMKNNDHRKTECSDLVQHEIKTIIARPTDQGTVFCNQRLSKHFALRV